VRVNERRYELFGETTEFSICQSAEDKGQGLICVEMICEDTYGGAKQ